MQDNWEEAAFSLIKSISSSKPTPGGGAAGAVSAAMGCALGEMISSISVSSALVAEEDKLKLSKVLPSIVELKQDIQKNISADAKAFAAYMQAAKTIYSSSEERTIAIQKALKHAAEVPLETAILSVKAAKTIKSIKQSISPRLMSDYFAAETLLKAAVNCSAEIVKLNLKYIKDKNISQELILKLENCLKEIENL